MSNGHNPFKGRQYALERITGNQFAMLMALADEIQSIKLVADNIESLRSGNIELRMTESILEWKYINEEEWHVLGDFAPFFNRLAVAEAEIDILQGNINTINSTLLDLNGRITELEEADE